MFAKKSYTADGRGVIQVAAPDVPDGISGIVLTHMVYHTLPETQRLTAGLQGDSADDRDALLRMMETYDPITQTVVTIAFATGNPITVKMKLERPFHIDEPGGVH